MNNAIQVVIEAFIAAQKQCVCGGSEFAINILKKIGLISEKSRAVPKLESKVYIIVI